MTDENPIPAEVFPPGDFIKEEIEARQWTQEDLARILGKPLPTVNQILKGKRAIIADTAKRLAAAFGNTAEFWLNLEAAWQLHREPASEVVAQVQARADLYSLVPVREMVRRGWIGKTSTPDELDRELRTFFGVRDLTDVPELAAAARASTGGDHGGMTAAQWAWCRRACQVSSLVHAKRFRRAAVERLVDRLVPLMSDPAEVRHVPKLLADAGIRLVIVEHMAKSKMDGAALWPTQSTPVIGLSMRYGRIDYFWFTLLHELAHIIHRDGQRADAEIIEHGASEDQIEERANTWAASHLVQPDHLESFILRTTPLYSASRVSNFAKRMGVHPGIVVGQLKFRGELDWSKLTRLHADVRHIIQAAAICDGWGHVAPASRRN